MSKLHITIVSPASTFYDGEADYLQLPVHDGLIGVYPGHAPLVSILGVGPIIVKDGGKDEQFIVDGGFLEIRSDRVTVLATQASSISDIDAEQARRDYEEALQIKPLSETEFEGKQQKLASSRVRMRLGS